MIGRTTRLLLLALITLCLVMASSPALEAQSPATSEASNSAHDAESKAAFTSIIPVLHHPRCMNCHSTGDFPRQGDDSHRHTMEVRRGPNGDGAEPVQCSTCHQDHNLAEVHTPPGAPDWHLPSPEMPMIWEGLSDHQLCVLFTDAKQNGGRTVEQIEEHMHTPLVLWGWNPGPGRTPVPFSQSDFLEKVHVWVSTGAACP